ncbi:MAG TPA: hypothetical protein ENJ98_02635 [Thiolapillus brandeum]|uniref:Uncharacterized protein n=1 Tax=Thiolapillus brandeum TaxID=1076588 RepID=A0A7C5IYA2_9GAMM|nr:hypothetical protein [Thiolapillus brandeum]
MNLERQHAALDLFELLAQKFLPPGDYLALAEEYVWHHRERLRRESRRHPKRLGFKRYSDHWEIEEGGLTIAFPRGLLGLEDYHAILSTTLHGLVEVDRITNVSPNALAKRLERARDRLYVEGAVDLARFLKQAVSVGREIQVRPVPGYSITVERHSAVIRARSAIPETATVNEETG